MSFALENCQLSVFALHIKAYLYYSWKTKSVIFEKFYIVRKYFKTKLMQQKKIDIKTAKFFYGVRKSRAFFAGTQQGNKGAIFKLRKKA